jgi:hypothetical protein
MKAESIVILLCVRVALNKKSTWEGIFLCGREKRTDLDSLCKASACTDDSDVFIKECNLKTPGTN